MFLTKFAIKRPVATAMLFLAFSILGYISWGRLPIQLFPNLTFPQLTVQVSMPGASPEKIEKDLLIPIEGEIARMNDIESISSVARMDRGQITIEFNLSANIKYAALKLEQKVNQISATLPVGSRALVGPTQDTEMFTNFLMVLSVRGPGELEYIRRIAEDKIKPELEKIDGISSVSARGGQLREVQVLIDEFKARQYEINPVNVMNKINAFNLEKEFLGKVYDNNTMKFVTLSGQVTQLSELENLIIDPTIPLKLSDIAEIKIGGEEQKEIYRINGKQSVGMFLLKDNESNLLRTAERVENEIHKLNEVFAPEGIEIVIDTNTAEVMRDTIDQVKKLAIIGALMALLVLLFFLRNLKTVSVILISIPVSLLVTFNLMYYFDLTINIISLMGLAIAVGMLVDNSIVVLENIFRHYDLGASPKDAALKGCTEVSRAIIASTGTTIAVFMPAVFQAGMIKVVFTELSLAIIFPLLVSLVAAFMIIPSFTAQFLMRRGRVSSDIAERKSMIKKWQQSRLMEIFTLFLKSRLRSPIWTVVILLVLFLISLPVTLLVMVTSQNVEEQTDLEIFVNTPHVAGLMGNERLVSEVERLADSLDIVKEIRSLIAQENGTVTLTFKDKDERGDEELNLSDIRRNLRIQTDLIPRSVGDVSYENQNVSGRRGSGGGGGGGGDPMSALFGSNTESVLVRGYGLQEMKNVVEEIESRLQSFVEIRSVNSNLGSGAQEMQIWPDKEALDRHNISFSSVMNLLWASRREGQEMTTQMKDEDGEILIRVKLSDGKEGTEERGRSIDDIKNAMIPVPGQGNIPIKTLSNIVIDEGPRAINRVDQVRQSKVTYRIKDDYQDQKQQLEDIRKRIDKTIQDIRLPSGFTVEIIHEEQSEVISTILKMLLIAGLLIFMILASAFESIKLPWIIYATVPMAVIGALWALVITGTPLSMFSGIALLVLLGIVVNNGIILIDYITILRKKYSRNRAVLLASRARLRPILMTSITTTLGVLPFAIKTGAANEIWPPFAITLIGGLGFSTLLTLVYIPVLYISIDNFLNGLKKAGKKGLVIDIILSIAMVTWIYFWLDSTLWKIIISIIGLSILNAVLYNFYDYLDKRKRNIELGNDLTISIRNLTKIYNEPKRIVKEWNIPKRREEHLRKRNEFKREPKDYIGSMIWKAPIFLFFMYLHTFFTNGFWLFVLSALTYFLAGNIIMSLRGYFYFRKHNEEIDGKTFRFRKLTWLGRNLSVILMFGYLHIRWAAHPAWAIVFCILWFFISYARRLTLKVYRGEIQLHKVSGPFKKIRRTIYGLLINIPVIGRKKTEIRALHAVNLEIKNGMFGLLGPNGAGKSTLMRLISNIYYQSRGVVYFNQYQLGEYRDYIQKFIGYLPQKFGLYGNFSAWQFLNYLALLNRFGNKKRRQELVESVLKNVNLWDRKDDKLKTYSGGMKQRVGIAQALLNLPKIIVVDEPTSGLDPRERIRFRNMLSEMSKNRIVIFSTHIVEDISTSCRELAVLNKGQVIFQGEPEVMRKKAEGKVWESFIPEKDFSTWNSQLKIVAHIKQAGEVKIRYIDNAPPENLAAENVEPNLEDAYLLMLNPI